MAAIRASRSDQAAALAASVDSVESAAAEAVGTGVDRDALSACPALVPAAPCASLPSFLLLSSFESVGCGMLSISLSLSRSVADKAVERAVELGAAPEGPGEMASIPPPPPPELACALGVLDTTDLRDGGRCLSC